MGSRELLVLVASGLADAPALDGFSCTVESAVNMSTGEHLPLPEGPVGHSLSDLERSGHLYTRRVQVENTHHSEETTHSIDGRTGRYEAVSIEKRHDWGEEHLIRRTGVCIPVEKSG